ncbi:Pectin methylesterase [Alteracholeplasma palmae J233]|uniref:Pectin methylesterase n=2 Tax=Acholeplasma palmae TaxID=38986 RepID=U4KN72_ALTPJ|nr:Pectin methylesterase [Alteracholeplasma palmae J233]
MRVKENSLKVIDITKKMFVLLLSSILVVVLVACNKKAPEIHALAISSFPTKTVYKVGESFDKTGIEVIGVMSNQTVIKLNEGTKDNEYQFSGFDSQTEGTKKVEVKSGNFKTHFTVIVNNNKDEARAQITFMNDKTVLSTKTIDKGSILEEPALVKQENQYFVGWFIEETNYMWNFSTDQVKEDVTLKAKYVTLDESHVILDAYMKEEQASKYTFKTLQTLKEANIKNNTTVYFAPGVYWADDYLDTNEANTPEHPGLIGIEFFQTGLKFVGLTSNADDVRIAGNRGQTVGSKGNWNVIGVGQDFSSYNISIANYCSTDLVYPRDVTQNLKRRTDARVQAQTLATLDAGDRMYFENTRFVSHLNLMAAGNMQRAYFKDCYFQLTDDAIAVGKINVYENCTFDLYGAHPTWGGIETLALFLNSTFNIKYDSGILYWAKSGGTFGLIDSVFTGKIEEVRWEDFQRPDAKHYVYNNKDEKGNDIIFAKDYPAVTEYLTEETLPIFKNKDNTYNISNILGGNDGWNPTLQTVKTPFKLVLASNTTVLESSQEDNQIVLTPVLTPSNILSIDSIEYTYDESLFDFISQENGVLKLKAKLNQQGKILQTVITARSTNKLVSQVTVSIRPELVEAPKFIGEQTLTISNNKVVLNYEYDHPGYTDHSNILWYIGTETNKQERLVGQTTLNKPQLEYQLSRTDLNKYVSAVIIPKYEFSPASTEIALIEGQRVITLEDIKDKNIISTNFANIAWKDNLLTDKNVWYADSHRPKDITVDWGNIGEQEPWVYTYATGGQSGQAGALYKNGLLLAKRGARLLYNTSGEYSDVSMKVLLSPEKTAGQGFGSATEQYLDIYIKYDVETQNGYALRIQRVAKDRQGTAISSGGNAVRFSLVEYKNGIETVLEFEGNDIMSSAFMPDTTIILEVKGNKLSADITTASEQTGAQATFGLPHEVHLSYDLKDVNNYGGFGFQHTGTTSVGNRVLLQELEVKLTDK